MPRGALILILVRIMTALGVVASRRTTRRARGHTSCAATPRAQLLDQWSWNLFQKPRRNAGLGQIGSISTPVNRTGEDQLIHRPRHPHVTKPPLLFNVFRDQHGS